MKRILPVLLAAALVIAGGAYWLTRPSAPTPDLIAQSTTSDEAVEAAAAAIEDMEMGSPDAPVTVIEYASFTCPHCASFHDDQLKKLKAEYIDTGKVRFIFREVYFDRFGLWASIIARCGGQEKFFGITDLMFKTQSDWASAGDPVAIAGELRKIGRLSGMDGDTIETCLKDEDNARALIAWYQGNAAEHEIDSTPSLVIDGQKYSNMSFDKLKGILDEKLGG